MTLKNTFLLFAILLLSFSIDAQSLLGGKATYTLTLANAEAKLSLMKKKAKEEFRDASFIRMMEKMYKTKELSYTLLFNDNESLFFRSKDSEDSKGIISILGSKGKWYTNLKDKSVLNEKDAFSILFLVKSEMIDWKIVDETKKIKGYTCYKAVGKKKFHGRKGWFEKEITVWYTKEIPYKYGPAGYAGVPGFIVKGSDSNLTYQLNTINLDVTDKIKIVKPQRGRKITHLDFQKESKKLAEQSREMMKGN